MSLFYMAIYFMHQVSFTFMSQITIPQWPKQSVQCTAKTKQTKPFLTKLKKMEETSGGISVLALIDVQCTEQTIQITEYSDFNGKTCKL